MHPLLATLFVLRGRIEPAKGEQQSVNFALLGRDLATEQRQLAPRAITKVGKGRQEMVDGGVDLFAGESTGLVIASQYRG